MKEICYVGAGLGARQLNKIDFIIGILDARLFGVGTFSI